MSSFKHVLQRGRPLLAAGLILFLAGVSTCSSPTSSSGSGTTAPSISVQPVSISRTVGQTAILTVTASGSNLSYQWSKDGSAVSGATSASYSLSSVTLDDAGSYTVALTNSYGSVTSSSADISVTDSTVSNNAADVVAAVSTFLATLDSSQQAAAQLSYTLANAEVWSNIPVGASSRNGIQYSALSTAQLTAALNVEAAALGSQGYTLFEEIRLADGSLSKVNSSMWGVKKYYLAVLGTPSTTDPWMLQLGGHHIAYNITYNGGATSGTPMFVGVEPPNWTDSSGVAHAALENQRAAVQALAQVLLADSSYLSAATLSGTFTDVVMGPNGTGSHDTNYPQTYPTTGRGLAVSSLTTDQQALVTAAIEAWVNTMSPSVAASLLSDYEDSTALASTYVGIGLDSSSTVDFSSNPSGLASQHSYLRIDGPRVWIEFVVQQGIAYTSKVHYHTLWRDKTADYGAEF